MNIYVKYKANNETQSKLHIIQVEDESVGNCHIAGIEAVRDHLMYTKRKIDSPILTVINGGKTT
jgi:hypothetical protein